MSPANDPSISFRHVTKRYGGVTALDDFSACVAPGRITAFLGANGSGKTTSMRVLLGLAAPTAGTALIGNHPYRDLPHPLQTVGAVLDQGFQPNRSARNHLRVTAVQAGASRSRVDAVLDLVGLTSAAGRRVGGFSLGMRQRLALASALIGEPSILVMDEPFNGLDPEGISTMRVFLRQFADSGGTVLLSSHLLAEVAHSADDAIIIDRGRLVTSGPIAGLVPATGVIKSDHPGCRPARRCSGESRRAAPALAAGSAHRARALRQGHQPDRRRGGGSIVDLRADGADLQTIFEDLIHPKEYAS